MKLCACIFQSGCKILQNLSMPILSVVYFKHVIRQISIYFFLLLGCGKTFGQQYNFINYTTTSGLVNNQVRGIYQDSKGVLYITTIAGISIFDGYRFRNYTYRDGIKFDYIKNFGETDSGTVYLFGNTGSEAYIFNNGTFKRAIKTPVVVTQFFKSGKSARVCTDAGIFELKNNTFKKIALLTDTAPKANAYYKYQALNDSIALVLRVFPNNEFSIINTKSRLTIYSFSSLFGYQLFIDSKKRVWIPSDSDGPKMITPEELTAPFTNILMKTPAAFNFLAGVQVNNVAEDQQGNIWFSTTGMGLIKLQPDGKCRQISKKNGLLSDVVFNVMIDRENNLWIGTESGLQMMQNNGTTMFNKSAGLMEEGVFDALVLDSRKVLASTLHYLSVIDTYTDSIQNHHLPFVKEGYIYQFQKNPKQEIWGLSSHRLVKINPNSKNVFKQVSPFSEESLKSFTFLQDGTPIALSSSHLIVYSNGNFIKGKKEFEKGRCIYKDDMENLWVATSKGLFIMRAKKTANKYEFITTMEKFTKDRNAEINLMIKGPGSNVWACTKQQGIYMLSIEGDSIRLIRKISRDDGLSNNTVKALMFDNDSTLFCSTISGIDKLILDKDGKVRTLSSYSEISGPSYTIIRDSSGNNILFPGVNGLTQYNKLATSGKTSINPKTVFTNLIVNGNQCDSLLVQNEIQLANNDNNLIFYFSPYHFSKNYYFAYWLDNGEKEVWQEIHYSNSIQFNNLPHKRYALHIKTFENSSGKLVSLINKKFTIAPKWYQTLLFSILSLLLITMGLLLVFSFYTKGIKRRATLKQHITETEIAALKAQMNPHFIFNCINSIDAFIHSNDKYNATLYLNKFARLLRNILDSSKQNTVAFTKDIDTLKLYIELEELRHENKFKTNISIDDELLSNDYKVPPLIIQPFVENAILHGLKNREDNEGLLEIKIEKVADKIKYSIKDNGIGRKAASAIAQNKEASYGMQMSNDRIKLFNKEEKPSVQIIDLYKNDFAVGTEVKICLNII